VLRVLEEGNVSLTRPSHDALKYAFFRALKGKCAEEDSEIAGEAFELSVVSLGGGLCCSESSMAR
jgi:hypothetical protein